MHLRLRFRLVERRTATHAQTAQDRSRHPLANLALLSYERAIPMRADVRVTRVSQITHRQDQGPLL